MLFHVCSHYEEEENTPSTKEDTSMDVCFVCYDVSGSRPPIELRKQTLYTTECDCNGDIHETCLRAWIRQHSKCPICRVDVQELKILPVGTSKQCMKFTKRLCQMITVLYIAGSFFVWLYI